MVPETFHNSSGTVWCFLVSLSDQHTGSLKSCQVSEIWLYLIEVLVCFPHFVYPPSAPHPFSRLPPPLQIPSAGQLMEAVRVKMKERKVLTEELAMLAQPVSEKAWLPGLRLGKLSSSSFSPSLLLPSPVPTQWELGWAKLSRGSRTNICEKSAFNSLWTTGSTQQPSFCKWALDICVSAQCTVYQRGPFSTKLIYSAATFPNSQ